MEEQFKKLQLIIDKDTFSKKIPQLFSPSILILVKDESLTSSVVSLTFRIQPLIVDFTLQILIKKKKKKN